MASPPLKRLTFNTCLHQNLPEMSGPPDEIHLSIRHHINTVPQSSINSTKDQVPADLLRDDQTYQHHYRPLTSGAGFQPSYQLSKIT